MTKMGCSAKWIDLVSFWDPFSVPFFSFFPFLLYRIFVAVWGPAFCFFLDHFWGPIWVQNAPTYFGPICSFSLPTQFAPRGRFRGYLSEFQGRFWGQISSISCFLFILWFILDVSFALPEHDCFSIMGHQWCLLLGPVRMQTETQVLSHIAIWWMYVAACHSPEKNPVFQFRAM